MPVARRLRLSNTTFQQASRLRVSYQLPQQMRWQTTEAQATTSASGVDHAPQSQPDRSQKKIKYSADSYGIKRDSRFKELTAEDVKFFKDLLGSESAVIDGLNQDATDDLEGYNADWMKKYRGQAKLVVKPQTTEQVSKIMKYCNDNLLAVNPQGGNTGLVGGFQKTERRTDDEVEFSLFEGASGRGEASDRHVLFDVCCKLDDIRSDVHEYKFNHQETNMT
jgi:(R)-2-hydroxyglutarate---pyruvate transhydrogenase